MIQAFENVDRKYYVPVEKHNDGTEGNPYIDSPSRIGYAFLSLQQREPVTEDEAEACSFGATISAPHIHAWYRFDHST